jgi:hypothetical protein
LSLNSFKSRFEWFNKYIRLFVCVYHEDINAIPSLQDRNHSKGNENDNTTSRYLSYIDFMTGVINETREGCLWKDLVHYMILSVLWSVVLLYIILKQQKVYSIKPLICKVYYIQDSIC